MGFISPDSFIFLLGFQIRLEMDSKFHPEMKALRGKHFKVHILILALSIALLKKCNAAIDVDRHLLFFDQCE